MYVCIHMIVYSSLTLSLTYVNLVVVVVVVIAAVFYGRGCNAFAAKLY